MTQAVYPRGLIPENVLEDILSRIDIVEVIASFIPLKRAGRNFKAVCPFHHEKTPSFMVSPDRQIYHCFGCSAGGNAFHFLMQYERLEFREAVEVLAKKAGVVLPLARPEDAKAQSLSTQLYSANEISSLFFAEVLNSPPGRSAREYLIKRGISENTAKLFRLGYAPDKWDSLITYLRNKGTNISLIEKAGLILPKQGGGYYDRFRNRIIFPIFDVKGRAIAFGGRVLDESLPKYMNSPETPVYIKGNNLYGLHIAKEAIRQEDRVVIVEGYMDLVVPYQAGVQNMAASCGTALTAEQARLIRRYTHNVVMVYDSDKAGELGTLRTLDLFIDEDMQVRVVSLPTGVDPDLFIRKNGVENFKEMIGSAEDLFDYKIKVMRSRHDIRKPEGKAAIASEMLPTIARFKNAILKAEYTKKLSEVLGVAEIHIMEELKKLKEPRYPAAPAQDSSRADLSLRKEPARINPTERLLIKLMLEESELIAQISAVLDPADFQDERISRIVSTMFQLMHEGKRVEPSSLVSLCGDEAMAQLICESALSAPACPENREQVINDCVQRLKSQRLNTKKQHLHEEIKAAQHRGDDEKLRTLIKEFNGLIKEGAR